MAGYSVTYTVVDNATKQIEAINKRITAMRAPMDRLSRQVSRFVDVSGLRKVAQGFEWIGKAASTVLRTLTAIVPVMGALTGAASIAGMVRLVQSYAAWSHTLTQNADDIGITTKQLQQFQDATRLAGGEASNMTDSMTSLHNTISDIAIGRGGAEAIQWFNRLGINIRDSNGHLRNTADLMPDVISKITDLKDPADRARAAVALLGSGGDKLVETFRQSSQTFGQWFSDVSRYQNLTDDQRKSLQLFTEAQGRATVAIDHLGQQVSVVLARDFGPLLQRFSEFVEKHTPEIIAAVDRISQRFAAWLENVDWSKVQAGIDSMIDGLKWVVNNLDTIKDVAEVIVGIFVAKWAVGIVAAIAQVVTALGAVGGGGGAAAAAGGAGLLGALGSVAAIAGSLAAAYGVHKGLEAGSDAVERRAFGDEHVDAVRKMQEEGHKQFLQQVPSWLGGTGGALGGLGTLAERAWKGPAALNLPQDNATRGAAIRDKLASDLNLSSDTASAMVGNLQAESGLKAVQERNPLGGGRGGFGWAQWTGPRRNAFEAYAKANGLDPSSDAANYGFLKQELNSPQYAGMMQRMRAAKSRDEATAIFEREYEGPAVSNVGVRRNYANQIAAAQAPPVQVGQTLNGAVDVNITHKNPPPNSAVTATGSGSVNVAPVRVEHQDMASI
jgi:hypothetical protein